MNHHFSNFIQAIRGITMRDASFARIRATLSSYADLHVMPERRAAASVLSPFVSWFAVAQVRYGAALMLLIVFVGGGVAGGAEKAAPGDALYAVKLNVNEKVSAVLADTPEEKAELATRLATRRVDEALTLLAEGKLDADTAAYLNTEVALQVEASAAAAATLESEGDMAGSLAVRTELAEELADRVATLDTGAAAGASAESREMATLSFSKEAPPPRDPGQEFASELRARAAEVAEARTHTAAAFLPGIAATVDFAAFGEGEPAGPVADAPAEPATATLMMAADEAATTSPETMQFDARAKYAPPANNAWPADGTEPLWQKGGR